MNMLFRKNKQKTYSIRPEDYEETYFEKGIREACLFRSLIREDKFQVIVEITEIHKFGCNKKGKFIELPVIQHRRFLVIGKAVEQFQIPLLLNFRNENGNLDSQRVYCSTDGSFLIGI